MTRDAPPSKSRMPSKLLDGGPQSSAPTATSQAHHRERARVRRQGRVRRCHEAIVPTRFSTGLHARSRYVISQSLARPTPRCRIVHAGFCSIRA